MAAIASRGAVNRILVIEDEERMAGLLVRALGPAGFQVETAATGLRGLALAREGGFALVILDLMLPDVDGLDVLKGLVESVPDQRVLILTAIADRNMKAQCLASGACDYVTKPFELADLVARVQQRVAEAWPAPPTSSAATA
jgi:DNA-binding response OmpR family regulator